MCANSAHWTLRMARAHPARKRIITRRRLFPGNPRGDHKPAPCLRQRTDGPRAGATRFGDAPFPSPNHPLRGRSTS
eukprot:11723364-Alexandrium_andersonii.AAC.1